MSTLTYEEAAHLLRRAGFGGTASEINVLAAKGREAAVDYLIGYKSINNQELEYILSSSFSFPYAKASQELNAENFNEAEIRAWWITRMIFTNRSLEEKLTLFWHNHFATSVAKVPVLHMYTQNLDLRGFALARFDDLLLKTAQGAAMLIWLDGVTSTKAEPNENFAREIQEVFSLGTHDVVTGDPNYTENDVKEIARAFTGWRFRKQPNDDSPFTYESYVDSNEADARAKTIYGQTANFTGEDVIAVIASRRSMARYLVKRLFDFFVYPLDPGSASDKATIEKFADVYFANDHSVKELVRAIFSSDEFFGPRARFALVKNPVELLVGALRMLNVAYTPNLIAQIKSRFEGSLEGMGMSLFSPPDVFGWKLNLGFINNETMIERLNVTDAVAYSLVATTFLGSYTKASTKKTVRNFLDILGPLQLDKAAFNDLRTYLTLDLRGNPTEWIVDNNYIIIQIRSLVRLIMCLPEFQLN